MQPTALSLPRKNQPLRSQRKLVPTSCKMLLMNSFWLSLPSLEAFGDVALVNDYAIEHGLLRTLLIGMAA